MKTLLYRMGNGRYILAAFIMFAITITGIISTLSSLRHEAIKTHRHIATLHANTIQEHFSQTLQQISLTMDRIPHLSNEKVEPEILSKIFLNLLQNTPYLRSISLLDETKTIQASSHQPNIGRSITLENFLPIPFNDTPLLRIGIPWIGRDFDTARPSSPSQMVEMKQINFIPLLKKIYFGNKPYYLIANLNTDFFANNYTQALPTENGTVLLWRLDGILLFSTHEQDFKIGSSYYPNPTLITSKNDNFLRDISQTSKALIGAYQLGSLFPFLIEININETYALGYWDKERSKVLWISTLLISLSGILILLLFIHYYREIERQKKQLAYEKQFHLAMKATQTGLWTWQFDTNILTWDSQCYLLLGYKPHAFTPSWEVIRELTHPDDVFSMFASILSQIERHPEFLIERRMKNNKGEWIWIQVRGKVIEYTPDHKPLFLTGVYINIDDQKQTEKLRISAVAFETQEAILITDMHEKVLKVNQAFTRITGYKPEDIIGKTPRILRSGKHDKAFFNTMWKALIEKGYWQGELCNKRKNGEIYIEYITITAIKDAQGVVTHYLANFNDISVHKALENKIQELAFYDPLTRLANRRLLQDKITQSIAKNIAEKTFGAVIFVDLDYFKQLNDTQGHDAGDMLLIQVAARLSEVTRQMDTVARFGGDEFVILLENLGNNFLQASTQSQIVANKILVSLRKPYSLASGDYSLGASLGITLFSEETTSADILLKEADVAMYHAKENGRNQISFFDKTHHDEKNK